MESSGDEYSLADKTIVNNEILGNVLRGLLYNVKEEDIFSTVDNCFSNDEVYEARKVLVRLFFVLFDNEEPSGRYMGPKEREIKKDENLTEIILKMQEIVRMDHDVEFCIPWNYSYVVVTGEEKRFQEMVRQKDLEIDMKFQNLEKTIEMKNREVISAVKNIVDNIGGDEKEGDIYIHSSGDSADAAGLKGRNGIECLDLGRKETLNLPLGAAGSGHNNLGNISYKSRQIDVQILNSLVIFVLSLFSVKFVLNILSIFSVNV